MIPRFFAVLAVVIVFFCGGLVRYVAQESLVEPVQPAVVLQTVRVGDQVVRVSIADTHESRQKGLSGRDGLASDEGMLFVFPEDGMYGFWMKDMRFPIDIVWLSDDWKIVHMAENVSPSTYPQSFTSSEPARYVLELPAGYAALHGIGIGDIVRH